MFQRKNKQIGSINFYNVRLDKEGSHCPMVDTCRLFNKSRALAVPHRTTSNTVWTTALR